MRQRIQFGLTVGHNVLFQIDAQRDDTGVITYDSKTQHNMHSTNSFPSQMNYSIDEEIKRIIEGVANKEFVRMNMRLHERVDQIADEFNEINSNF